MELPDPLGPGLCHMLEWRTMDGAWLCDRCTGLYIGGLFGVAHAEHLRGRPRWVIALLIALLFAPVAADKLLLGIGSPLDVTAFRLFTGFLGGAALGLLLAIPGMKFVRWPQAIAGRARRPWLWLWAALLASIAAFAVGLTKPLNALVLLGLIALCLAGTGWALGLIAGKVARLRGEAAGGAPPRFGLPALLALVFLELALVAVTPNVYKPNIGWLWWALERFGVGPGAE